MRPSDPYLTSASGCGLAYSYAAQESARPFATNPILDNHSVYRASVWVPDTQCHGTALAGTCGNLPFELL